MQFQAIIAIVIALTQVSALNHSESRIFAKRQAPAPVAAPVANAAPAPATNAPDGARLPVLIGDNIFEQGPNPQTLAGQELRADNVKYQADVNFENKAVADIAKYETQHQNELTAQQKALSNDIYQNVNSNNANGIIAENGAKSAIEKNDDYGMKQADTQVAALDKNAGDNIVKEKQYMDYSKMTY